MSEKTNIAWAHSTYNPHRGCRKVSDECKFCYIVDTPPLRRIGQKHGDARMRGSDKVLKAPYAWNERARRDWDNWEHVAQATHTPGPEPQHRVFCMSLGDWLDDENVPIEWTAKLMRTVHDCDALTWLMLTKRSEKWRARMEAVLEYIRNTTSEEDVGYWVKQWLDGMPPSNVWFGGSIMNGKVPPTLLQVPARIHWLSAEPLLPFQNFSIDLTGLKWIVIGGESGKDENRRDCGVNAICQLARDAKAKNLKVFVKQDCHRSPGQQGRIPDDIWALKEFPSDPRA